MAQRKLAALPFGEETMITALVQFPLRADMDLATATELYRKSAPKYRDMAGLIRKYYLFGSGTGGGVYLWESRAAAEKVYDAAWRKMIKDRYGAEPTIRYFETPVVVDNQAGAIISEAAE
jgi:hypothetical protein